MKYNERLPSIRGYLFFILLNYGAADVCHDASFKIDGLQYNVNHLKNHLPPNQKYSDKSNLFGSSVSDPKKYYIFFNLADYVHNQKIDNNHHISTKCFPRTQKADRLTNTPVACIPEDQASCENEKDVCWIALGSCKNVSYFHIEKPGDGIQLLYSNGDFQVSKLFLVLLLRL